MNKERLEFGITFQPDMPVERIVALAKLAEDSGFTYAWTFDSHVLFKEPYPILTLLAAETQKLRLGTMVTNPLVRDVTVTASLFATLNIISGGRMEMGIGRGYSSLHMLGRSMATVDELRRSVEVIRALASGQQSEVGGQKVQLKWATGSLPIWVAGYGPQVLSMIGEVADGLIVQIADPFLVRWCAEITSRAAMKAGRSSEIKVMAAAPVWVSDDLAKARSHVRWFPALVGSHLIKLLERYKDELPAELTEYVRGREWYQFYKLSGKEAYQPDFVPDEIVDRFTIIGPPEVHRRKLQELIDAGVHQFNIYLNNGDEARILEVYRDEVIPNFLG